MFPRHGSGFGLGSCCLSVAHSETRGFLLPAAVVSTSASAAAASTRRVLVPQRLIQRCNGPAGEASKRPIHVQAEGMAADAPRPVRPGPRRPASLRCSAANSRHACRRRKPGPSVAPLCVHRAPQLPYVALLRAAVAPQSLSRRRYAEVCTWGLFVAPGGTSLATAAPHALRAPCAC